MVFGPCLHSTTRTESLPLTINEPTSSENTYIECGTHEPVVVLLQRLVISQINCSHETVVK